MSGHKKATITISQKEYQRLHKNELRMRFMQRPDEDHFEAARSQALEAYQQDLQNLEYRQRNFEDLINGFEDHLRNLETEASSALIDQQTEISETICQAVDQTWNETQSALQSQEAQFNSFLQDLSANIESQLAQITDQQNTERSNRKNQFEKVRQWIKQAYQMLQFIQQHYDHEKFAPGEIETHHQGLRLAQDNLENGFPETALGTSQQVYLALSGLRVRLESQQHQWDVLLELANQKMKKLYLLACENRSLPGLDLDGNEIDEMLDIDFWSSRKLSRLINQIQGTARNLYTNRETIHTEDLSDLLENQIPHLEQELEEIIYQARLNALNSQLRINIADMVLQALATQGYSIGEAQYQNMDMRQEYSMKVQNPEGNQVLIQVIPNQGCENELQLHSLNNTARTQHELRQQTREISNALNHFGLSMGPVTEMEHWNPEKPTLRSGYPRRVRSQIKETAWKQNHII